MKDNVILEVKNVEKFFYGNKKLFQKDRPVAYAAEVEPISPLFASPMTTRPFSWQ